jgi:hypothetical protein
MAREIPESDWKLFRQLHPIALERFCERVLADIGQLASETGKRAHERYLAIYQLVRRRDKELADAFNDKRRSTARLQLVIICRHGLLTEEELARFSAETRAAVQIFPGEG